MNFREDPINFTNFNRTDEQLELAWLFTQVVAGKTAVVQAKALENFFMLETDGGPYQRIRAMVAAGTLTDNLKTARLGQYTRLTKGFQQSLALNLRTATRDDLRAIPGVGYKTASYFILHTRPNQNIAVLDRHVIKHLGTLGYDVPDSTPNDKKYLVIEQWFLEEAKKANMTPADFDLMLWNKYSRS